MVSRKGSVRSKMGSLRTESNSCGEDSVVLIGAGLSSRLWHLAIQYAATVFNACIYSATNEKYQKKCREVYQTWSNFIPLGAYAMCFKQKNYWKSLRIEIGMSPRDPDWVSQDGGRMKNHWDEENWIPSRYSGRRSRNWV